MKWGTLTNWIFATQELSEGHVGWFMIVLWRTPWLVHKVLFPKRQSAGDTRVLRLKIVCCQKHVISYDQKSWPDLAKGTPTQTSQSHGRTSQVQVSHAFSSSDTMWPGRLNLKTVLVIPIKFANSIPFCLILLKRGILVFGSHSVLAWVLDSRAARGIYSGHWHSGIFGTAWQLSIQEGVPWDTAKPEGKAAPPYKCWSQLLNVLVASQPWYRLAGGPTGILTPQIVKWYECTREWTCEKKWNDVKRYEMTFSGKSCEMNFFHFLITNLTLWKDVNWYVKRYEMSHEKQNSIHFPAKSNFIPTFVSIFLYCGLWTWSRLHMTIAIAQTQIQFST
jgi:hypothetical protein